MSNSLVLVAGATGVLGHEIARLASESNEPVRALFRPTADPAKLERLKAMRVELVEGDLKRPASLDDALRGVGTVISTASSMVSRQAGDSIESVDERGQLALVDAAVRSGAKRFVFVSFAQFADDSPIQRAKRRVEQRLLASGLDYVILQPTYFAESWLQPKLGFDPIGGRAVIFGDGQQGIRWISFRDVARFAVAAIRREQFTRTTLELGGPDALSQLEVLRIFEELGAPPVKELKAVPFVEMERGLEPTNDPFQISFSAFKLGIARGQSVDIRQELKLLDGRLVTVRDYAQRLLATSKERS